jgi:hypothetical protein
MGLTKPKLSRSRYDRGLQGSHAGTKGWVVRGVGLALALAVTILSVLMARSASVDRSAPNAEIRYTEEGSFPRLQERVQAQLGFVNNLLTTLAVGLLAFAANASANSSELQHLGWREWLLFSGMILLALSLLAGIRLAHNRLQSHRITTRTARLRQLRDRLLEQHRSYEITRLARQANFFEDWAKYSQTKKAENSNIHTAARNLSSAIRVYTKETTQRNGCRPRKGAVVMGVSPIANATTRLVEALRPWYEKADDWTWWWLRAQTWTFMVGSLLLLVVPLSYYR